MIKPQRKKNIIIQAGSIGLDYISEGPVDIESIADDEQIFYKYKKLKESDKNAFNGLIMHKEGRFMIFLNMSQLKSKTDPRTRFTFAHELGHYFIAEHRRMLERYKSLTYKIDDPLYTYTQVEQEANLFASNLLMPSPYFSDLSKQYDIGMKQIYHLSQDFKTSFSSTAYRFINCNLIPCILIKEFNENVTATISSKMEVALQNKPAVMVNESRGKMDEKKIYFSKKRYFTQAISLLSSWVPSIKKSSKKDDLVVEQIMDFGEYGRYILVYPLLMTNP